MGTISSPLSRRALMVGIGAAAAMKMPSRVFAATQISVTDIAGRTVTLKSPARKIILGEGRLLYGLSTLTPKQPFERLVGWGEDMILFDPGTYRRYRAADPRADRITRFGNAFSGEFSTEQAIALDPDLVLFPLSGYQRQQQAGSFEKLARAGIATAVVDFREFPNQNTQVSIDILGRLLGLETEARRMNEFYVAETRRISTEVWNRPAAQRTMVFMERAAGFDPNVCCMTFGNANLGVVLQDAGGLNWGSARFPGLGGTVNPEAVLVEDPPVIIGTGADWVESTPTSRGVPFGYEATEDKVQAALKALADRPGWRALKAVQTKRFYSIYHQFYTSPAHMVAQQVFAKWLYPDAFKTLDPMVTWRRYHDEFSPFPLSGVFWAQLA